MCCAGYYLKVCRIVAVIHRTSDSLKRGHGLSAHAIQWVCLTA